MERTRTSGSLSVQGKVSQWHLFNGCSPTVWTMTSESDGPFTGATLWMYDIVVPRFAERVAKGEIFFNPFSSEQRIITSSGGNGPSIISKANACASPLQKHSYRRDGDWFGRWVSSSSLGPSGTLSLINESDLDALRVEVATSCRNKSGRGDSNLWEAAAEAHKTGRLLNGLGRRAIKAATDLKAASNEYLAYRYGVLPVISDTANVLKGLQKKISKTRRSVRAAASISSDDTTYHSVTQDGGYTVSQYQISNTETVYIRAVILEEFIADLSHNIGLSSKGLITLPWELTKRSFIADWFLNIGDYLGAMSPAFGYNVLGSCMSEKREKTSIWTATGTSEGNGLYSIVRSMTGSVVDSRVSKTRYALPNPGIVVKSDFRFDQFTRAGDAFALAAQILLK